jgi:hypothetical protein
VAGRSVIDSPRSRGDASVISTQMLPEDLQTTIHTRRCRSSPPARCRPFDDDEIEKAIAEIRDAIENHPKYSNNQAITP